MSKDDEWMRLFGRIWYSEDYHQRAMTDVIRERNEAVQRHEQLQRETEQAIKSLVTERDEARAEAKRWRDTCHAGGPPGDQWRLPWESKG